MHIIIVYPAQVVVVETVAGTATVGTSEVALIPLIRFSVNGVLIRFRENDERFCPYSPGHRLTVVVSVNRIGMSKYKWDRNYFVGQHLLPIHIIIITVGGRFKMRGRKYNGIKSI